jgi:hypothetical protein
MNRYLRPLAAISLAGICAVILSIAATAAAAEPNKPGQVVPITVDQFPVAETHHMMKIAIATFDCLGKWGHLRGFTPIDKQNVVRMNRDTLYSSLVLDLSEPATLTKPDIGDRYQSVLVVNQDHYSVLTLYKPGVYTLTQDKMGSRYVAVIARTLVDANDPEDVAQAQKAQDGLKVTQADPGSFEVPNWDPVALEKMREALKVLGNYLPNRDKAFGAGPDKVDPVAHLIASADAWGGWEPSNAVYQNVVPVKNDGVTPYILTLKDVPAGEGAFWSISVYNDRGYFEKNDLDRYVVNSRSAVTGDDGSVTIHFGGDPSRPNYLPIMPGWNYMLRIYLPRKAYFDGTWKAPEARPAD